MDVSSPISSVIPTLDGRALAALAGTTRPLNLTSVHRLAGRGSLSGIRQVLRRLSRTGLVLEVPGGYLLNRDHLAAPAVEALAQLRPLLFERIRRAVEAWSPPPLLVAVFGSAARGDGDENSDIDLLVVLRQANAGQDSPQQELIDAVQRWTGNNVHLLTLTPEDVDRLHAAEEPILGEWEHDLLPVLGSRGWLGLGSR